jgi:hypothetical protein
MKLFGSLTELVSIISRKDGYGQTLRPNQATTYTADRDFQLPAGDANQVLISANSTSTLTNKTFDADGTGNTLSNVDNGNIKSGAAIDATKVADGSVDNTEFQRLGTAGTAGSGNLVTTDGSQTLTSKTINGDSNTVQDLALTSIKTVLGDANKVLLRDASGVPTSALLANDNVDAAAAIARTKLASGSNNHVIINNGSGVLSSEAQLALTRGGTGASTADGALTNLLPDQTGNNGKALVTDGTNTSWAAVVTDPLTTRGDFLVRNASNVNDRLAVGSANTVLKSNGTDPSYGLLVNANIDAAAAISYSKLNLTNSIVNADINASAAIAGSKLQAASNTSAGTINYYLEGTFTPTWTASGTNFSAVTYTTQVGKYTRIGNLVTFTLRVDVSAVTVGSASGALAVGGLPHVSAASISTIVHVKSNVVDYSGSPTGGAFGEIPSGGSTILIGANVDAGSYVDALATANGGATARYLIISGSYLV